MQALTRRVLFIVLILSGFIAWIMPFTNEDLFLGLVAGRAIWNGNLATPDTWSYSVPGSLWVDQSWLSHLTYYVSYLFLDEIGPILIKAILLCAVAAILYMRCRFLSVSPGASMLAVALGILALAPFLKIRAENFGLFYFALLSAFLVGPPRWGRWRHLGTVAVLVLWANSHGSFILGLVLIGLRFLVSLVYALETKRSPDTQFFREHGRDAALWGITLAIALIGAAWANPYGPENLTLFFKQLFTESITESWVDWQPLLDVKSVFGRGYFKAFSTRPYLLVLGFTILVWIFLLVVSRNQKSAFRRLLESTKSDVFLEILIPLFMAPLVFKFQRMLLFGAVALVPVLGLGMYGAVRFAADEFPRAGAFIRNRAGKAIPAALAVAGLVVLGAISYKTAIRYSAANPLNPSLQDRTVASRLMTNTLSRKDAVAFLKDNGINGRVFTNVFLSDYLIFQIPEIQVFFDLRAQSFFPQKVMKAYLSVFDPEPDDVQSLTDVMATYGTELVIIDTADRPHYFTIATALMRSKSWICIYKDRFLVILAKNDPSRFPFTRDADELDRFKYVDSRSRILAQAFFSYYTTGKLSPGLIGRLQESLTQLPDPEAYTLFADATQAGSRCLTGDPKRYCESELVRLAQNDALEPNSALSHVASAVALTNILEGNEKSCGSKEKAAAYRKLRLSFLRILDQMKSQYGGI
ncbi:hypothetical protein [Desulfomonile tiedjei]|uniref:Glycosyltransferase RgtA/B/C/D-like domain-containing protein n=1 Tax=Desulfomonile tiedjei (strain ATCC 49306 / DSM 6799 / DCB-1) TaxID=706587 RepID=I4C370_DESTA|nr:hypothetical protein [Desulfomonile tiedjei]AFM24011.1 hypothetical protein Desti_1298 [Desulfomonile tiedjei DSM 6799]